MAEGEKKGRRALQAWFFGLWILEWILGWSGYLGPLEGVIEAVWLLGLAYFVVESRSGALPRALHTWGWMGAVLGIAGLRAWWVGAEGLLLFTELLRMAGSDLVIEGGDAMMSAREFRAMDGLMTSMLVGLAIGAVALFEAMIIAAMSRVGDLFREGREAPRVAFLPRLAVWILQAPIFVALIGAGLTAVAGAVGTYAHPESVAGEPLVDHAGLLWALTGGGLGAWALGVVHLRRLESLAAGGRVTRALLGLFGLAGVVALVAVIGLGLGSLLVAAVWLALQVGALRWARPEATGPAAARR